MKLTHSIALALCLTFLAAGCSRSENAQPAADQQQAAPAAQAGSTMDAPAADSKQQPVTSNKGKVLKSIQAAGYTYIQAETDNGVIWLAGSPVQVADGEMVSWTEPMMMHNFTSKTLKRTFDEILFVSHFIKESDANSAAAGSTPAGTDVTPSASAPAPVKTKAKVLSTKSVAGYTYLETEGKDGSSFWLAVPTTDVKAGQTVSWSGGAMMHNFTSKTLNKTFPEILFAEGVKVEEE